MNPIRSQLSLLLILPAALSACREGPGDKQAYQAGTTNCSTAFIADLNAIVREHNLLPTTISSSTRDAWTLYRTHVQEFGDRYRDVVCNAEQNGIMTTVEANARSAQYVAQADDGIRALNLNLGAPSAGYAGPCSTRFVTDYALVWQSILLARGDFAPARRRAASFAARYQTGRCRMSASQTLRDEITVDVDAFGRDALAVLDSAERAVAGDPAPGAGCATAIALRSRSLEELAEFADYSSGYAPDLRRQLVSRRQQLDQQIVGNCRTRDYRGRAQTIHVQMDLSGMVQTLNAEEARDGIGRGTFLKLPRG